MLAKWPAQVGALANIRSGYEQGSNAMWKTKLKLQPLDLLPCDAGLDL
jgi:hypothetical protein